MKTTEGRTQEMPRQPNQGSGASMTTDHFLLSAVQARFLTQQRQGVRGCHHGHPRIKCSHLSLPPSLCSPLVLLKPRNKEEYREEREKERERDREKKRQRDRDRHTEIFPVGTSGTHPLQTYRCGFLAKFPISSERDKDVV